MVMIFNGVDVFCKNYMPKNRRRTKSDIRNLRHFL